MTDPIQFNALVVPQAGQPISLGRKTLGAPGDDEVLVRVDYASINKMDAGLAQRNLFQLPEPYVLGFDFSGEVVRGSGAFRPGDRVFGRTPRGGCFAEYVVAKVDDVELAGPIPAPEASTYGIAFLTAYESLVLTARVQEHAGKWIYVAGAAGGVGHFAAQLAKLHGLKVIGRAGKPASVQLLRDMGLAGVIDYAHQDVVAEVMRLTDGRGADLVYDSTYSQASYEQSVQAVAAGGTYVRLGTALQLSQQGARDMSAEVAARGATHLIADLGRYGTDPAFAGRLEEVNEGMKRAVAWYAGGQLKPYVTGTVPFEAAALQQALEAFWQGVTNVGKVVVKVR